MNKKLKTYFNWSSGKDAALAFYHLKKDKKYQIDKLLTSVNASHDRVSMHGLRRELLEEQIKILDLPFTTIELPEEPDMEVYNTKMGEAVEKLQEEGFTHAAFGDIFLEDLRDYREKQLQPYGISCCFPLWKRDTKAIMQEFLDLGFKAIVITIKSELLDKSFVGRIIDENFIAELPENVDPCGENGEFHTFCFDGPIFSKPIQFEVGEKVFKEYKNPDIENKKALGFWFCDLIPVNV